MKARRNERRAPTVYIKYAHIEGLELLLKTTSRFRDGRSFIDFIFNYNEQQNILFRHGNERVGQTYFYVTLSLITYR
jgi:hypothetical protein